VPCLSLKLPKARTPFLGFLYPLFYKLVPTFLESIQNTTPCIIIYAYTHHPYNFCSHLASSPCLEPPSLRRRPSFSIKSFGSSRAKLFVTLNILYFSYCYMLFFFIVLFFSLFILSYMVLFYFIFVSSFEPFDFYLKFPYGKKGKWTWEILFKLKNNTLNQSESRIVVNGFSLGNHMFDFYYVHCQPLILSG